MTQLLDYHVGILRGYVLALNAPTQILHALDVLLGSYRSKAGPIIGSEADSSAEEAPSKPLPKSIMDALPISPEHSEEAKRVFTRWTSDEVSLVERMHADGKTPAEITKALAGRKYAGLYAKMTAMGLT